VGRGWCWEQCTSDFVAHTLAIWSLVSRGGGWLSDYCSSDFVAHVLATSSLVSLGGGWWLEFVSPIQQEAVAWTLDRFSRLELLLSHSEEILANALTLVSAELAAVRAAREELNL
jgi:hypothetical protein